MTNVPEIYGSLVFNESTMRERLPKATYKQLMDTIKEGAPLDDVRAVERLSQAAAERYEREVLSGLEGEPARFRVLFQRMKGAAVAVAQSVCAELAASDFTPAAFELGFGPGKDLPPVEVEQGVRLRLTGYVDRVDQWLHEGKRYVRVVDYKTGRKSFDLTEVWNGLGLQMLLYLFTLEEKGQALYGLPV